MHLVAVLSPSILSKYATLIRPHAIAFRLNEPLNQLKRDQSACSGAFHSNDTVVAQIIEKMRDHVSDIVVKMLQNRHMDI